MRKKLYILKLFTLFFALFFHSIAFCEVASNYSYIPPFLTNSMPPMVMLTMARDHRLYYEAYNDASDINEDGELDTRYNPNIEYYGYFDSHKYYAYNSATKRFEPRGIRSDKKAPIGDYWSGDFLNYVSMTRMDCLRKVLYGGYRIIDTDTTTVLERAYIPQDAHSFGKEYDSIAHDGFDIRDYTPLDLPLPGRRHLIATTALGNYDLTASPPTGLPILRVLTDSTARIWEWVATERPVVKSNFGGSTAHPGHPNTHAEFESMVATYAVPSRKLGDTLTPRDIDGSTNPTGNEDNFLNIITGTLTIRAGEGGTYTFAVDGDDAVEVIIDGNNPLQDGTEPTENVVCTTHTGSIALTAGDHTIRIQTRRSLRQQYLSFILGSSGGRNKL